jgi:hypothetical protein
LWYYLSEEFRTNYHDQLVEQQDEFLAINAHVQVLKVMKHHLDCPKLLKYICTSYSHDHKELCIQFTGLDLQTILASMKMHSCHTSIQFLGLYTLAQLPLSLQSKIQVAFDPSLDGISFILQVMRTLSNHSCIMEASCDWIYRLSCVKYVRKLLLASHVRTRGSIDGNGCGNQFSQSSSSNGCSGCSQFSHD